MTRIKKLLEVLSSYYFNLYYIKGEDMILSDFLSRQKVDDSNPCEIIPISFSMRAVLQDRYYCLENEMYMIQTRLQMKASGVQLPEVHGSEKRLDPHKILEKQQQPIVGLDIEKKPRFGQGRAGLRRKIALPSQYGPGSSKSKPIIINDEVVSVVEPKVPKPVPEIPRGEVLPPYLLPQNRPPPKSPDKLIRNQDMSNMRTDIEENSPFQENIISEIYERPDKSYFQEPVELKDCIDTNNVIQ